MRIGVSTRDAGWLISRSEPQVRRLVQVGKLVYAVQPTRLCAESVRRLFPDDALRPIREAALAAVLEGRIRVPATTPRYAKPLPITELPRLLREANHPTQQPNRLCDS
jgi:hypothetical protein